MWNFTHLSADLQFPSLIVCSSSVKRTLSPLTTSPSTFVPYLEP